MHEYHLRMRMLDAYTFRTCHVNHNPPGSGLKGGVGWREGGEATEWHAGGSASGVATTVVVAPLPSWCIVEPHRRPGHAPLCLTQLSCQTCTRMCCDNGVCVKCTNAML